MPTVNRQRMEDHHDHDRIKPEGMACIIDQDRHHLHAFVVKSHHSNPVLAQRQNGAQAGTVVQSLRWGTVFETLYL